MKFIDEVLITVQSGTGGAGCVSFRREKYIPLGGPDGGNGGKGGDIIFRADDGLNTLIHFRGKKVYTAPDGGKGSGSQCSGAAGEDLVLKVPVGTLIFDQENHILLADLATKDQEVILAKGGRGGLGNAFFKSSTNQAPRFAQEGDKGSVLPLKLELKLLADIALVGFPNAGKSTLISSLSAARPKIADYPFTTLEPNLGVVQLGEETVVVADIPGLIEKASEGKGLGIKFLKHIERTHALVHLIDCSLFAEPYEAIEAYATIREELYQYSEGLSLKPEVVCLTKIDAMLEEEIEKFRSILESHLDKNVMAISAVSGTGLMELKKIMIDLKKLKEKDGDRKLHS